MRFEESKSCDHDVLAAVLGESQFSTLLANERSLGDSSSNLVVAPSATAASVLTRFLTVKFATVENIESFSF